MIREFLSEPFGRILITLNICVWIGAFLLLLTIGAKPIHAFIGANLAVTFTNIIVTIGIMVKM